MPREIDEIKAQIVKEIYGNARKRFPTRSYIQKGLFDTLSIDLADMSEFAEENDGCTFLLVVIDIFSKKLYVRPLKRKTMKEVAENMEDILKDIKYKVTNIQSDNGTEFKNKVFKSLMHKYGINHYFSYSPIKCSMAERVIRTLKSRIMRFQTLFGTFRYIDDLNDIVKDYNNTKHSKIKLKPNQVTRKNEKQLLNDVYKSKEPRVLKRKKLHFIKGDHVRISRIKKTFEKGANKYNFFVHILIILDNFRSHTQLFN